MEDRIQSDYYKLLFGVRRSIRYHHRRRLFFDRLHQISTFLSAATGTATVASLLANASSLALLFGISVAVFSVIDLVVGAPQAARLHHDLARKFIALEKAMTACTNPSQEDMIRFTNERLDIESEEPPVLKVLDAICHNELIRALGHDPKYYAKITWYQRLFAHFFDIREHKIQLQTEP